jgi:hypothetical protein
LCGLAFVAAGTIIFGKTAATDSAAAVAGKKTANGVSPPAGEPFEEFAIAAGGDVELEAVPSLLCRFAGESFPETLAAALRIAAFAAIAAVGTALCTLAKAAIMSAPADSAVTTVGADC